MSGERSPKDESVLPFGNLGAELGVTARGRWDGVSSETRMAIQRAGFRVTERISQGATGVVLKAVESGTERRVAIKVLSTPGSEQATAQFHKERLFLAAANLPKSVVRYYRAVEGEGAQPALVLEFVDGTPILEECKRASLERRLELIECVAREVDRLHEAKILWGDLSHNNVLVDRDGEVRLIDFGLASLAESPVRGQYSVSAAAAGTDGIASPERLAGERASRLEDVHAAAALGYRILSGRFYSEGLQGEGRERATRQDYRAELLAAGVARPVADGLARAMRPLEPVVDASAGRRCAVRDEDVEVGALDIADGIRAWRKERDARRARRRQRLLLAAVALPLAVLAGLGWLRFLESAREGRSREIAVLDGQLQRRPNLRHRAVAGAVDRIDALRETWRDQLRSGALGPADATARELIAAQRAALDASHGIEALEPLRETLGEVLARTPWQRSVPAMDQAVAECQRRHQEAVGQVDRGELAEAAPELRALQRDLARLAAVNASAARALEARTDFERLRDGVAPRIQGLADFAPVARRGEEAGTLLAAVSLDDRDLRDVTREYQQAQRALETLLERHERSEERAQRLAGDATRAERLEERVGVLEADVVRSEASLATLRAEHAGALEQLGVKDARIVELETALAEAQEGRPAVVRAASVTGEAGTPPDAFENGLGQRMIGIPAGTFQMGSPDGELGRGADEALHTVTLTRAYWMAATEVTQGQWKAVMGDEPWIRKSFAQAGPDFAANHIGWNGAAAFCERLTFSEAEAGRLPEGFEYRLPTEAEWEYACRAGTSTAFSFGGDWGQLHRFAVYVNSSSGSFAHQVATKGANPWGLFDMHGNVWEWCLDSGTLSAGGGVESGTYVRPALDPVGISGPLRVLRGGGWTSTGASCRSAVRIAQDPSLRIGNLGFRPVLTARSSSR